MNKKVIINGQTYEMYQVKATNWVFVRSRKTKKTYPVARVIDGDVVRLEEVDQLSAVTNRELADAWVNS